MERPPHDPFGPQDCRGIERLAHAAHVAKAGELLRSRGRSFHQHADGRGSGVEDGHAVARDELIPALGGEPRLEDGLGCTHRPGTDDAVGGSRDPAWIGGTPVDVIGTEIEDVACSCKLRQDRTVYVLRALGTAGGP